MNYFVFSYGGTGSTMLCSFLSRYGKSFHLHDKVPPLFLTNRPVEAPDRHTEAAIHLSQDPYYKLNPNDCRVIYIYRDPVIAKISRPSWQHCYHIGGDFRQHQKLKRKPGDNLGIGLLEDYVRLGLDLNQYEEHFDNWMVEGSKREYSILYINYTHLWENLNVIFEYCQIPISDIVSFPRKRETKKSVSDNILKSLTKMYNPLQKKIQILEPVILSKGEKQIY
jgi:hypothetical protein